MSHLTQLYTKGNYTPKGNCIHKANFTPKETSHQRQLHTKGNYTWSRGRGGGWGLRRGGGWGEDVNVFFFVWAVSPYFLCLRPVDPLYPSFSFNHYKVNIIKELCIKGSFTAKENVAFNATSHQRELNIQDNNTPKATSHQEQLHTKVNFTPKATKHSRQQHKKSNFTPRATTHQRQLHI